MANEDDDKSLDDLARVTDINIRAAAAIARQRFTTWHSKGPKLTKHHLLRDCEGLERTPKERIGTRRFSSAAGLLKADGRPCRRCALQAAVIGSWDATWGGARTTFTISGLPSPAETNRGLLASITGDERVAAIAVATGLSQCHSVCGTVAWGTAPANLCDRLAHNFHMLLPPPELALTDDIVTGAWALTLTNDNTHTIGGVDIWTLARSLAD